MRRLMKIVNYFYFILLSFLLYSCAAYQGSDNSNKSKDDELQSINVEGGNHGLLPNKGNSTNTLLISEIGQREALRQGEKRMIIFDYWDMESACLVTTTDPYSKEIFIELKDKDDAIITLKKKCDVVELRGVDMIPPIVVSDGLNPEQIIITPLFDHDCNVLGYQIRYGSTERGCTKVAKDVLNQFHNCVGSKKNSFRKKVPNCLQERWLGIPCP